jgi:hypothetical protein
VDEILANHSSYTSERGAELLLLKVNPQQREVIFQDIAPVHLLEFLPERVDFLARDGGRTLKKTL